MKKYVQLFNDHCFHLKHDQYQFSQNELEDSSNYTSNYTSKPKKLRFVEGDNEDFRNYQRLCRGEDIKVDYKMIFIDKHEFYEFHNVLLLCSDFS